jgi:thiol:disulfide interchange protein DsbD
MVLALALGLTWIQTPQHATAEIVTSITAAKQGEPFYAGIVLRMDPSWHIYWTNPGETGSPTTVTWKLPEGWTAGPVQWPVPVKFNEGARTTYGYDGSVLLIAKIMPPTDVAKGKYPIDATVKWVASNGTGTAIGSADLHVERGINANNYDHPVWHERLLTALKGLPAEPTDWSFEANPIKGGFILKCKPPTPLGSTSSLPIFYSSDPGVLQASAPQNFRTNSDGTFWLALAAVPTPEKAPDHLRGLLLAPKMTSWKDGVEAVVVDVPITPGSAKPPG